LPLPGAMRFRHRREEAVRQTCIEADAAQSRERERADGIAQLRYATRSLTVAAPYDFAAAIPCPQCLKRGKVFGLLDFTQPIGETICLRLA